MSTDNELSRTHQTQSRMPRFAAKLSMRFTEVPLLEPINNDNPGRNEPDAIDINKERT